MNHSPETPKPPLPALADCWAKTNTTKQLALSVRDHCLNVGAVGALVLQSFPNRLAGLLPKSLGLLAALHDVGKITVGFQRKSDKWLYFEANPQPEAEGNHAKVSHAFFGDLIEARNPARWSIALGGHHGRYASIQPRIAGLIEPHQSWAKSLRLELTTELISLFGELPTLDEEIPDHHIHLVTGFITFSDWIGSNEDFFPLATPARLGHETNPIIATKQAKAALAQLHWTKPLPSSRQAFGNLFPFEPNHLQKALLKIGDAPGLYIVEATMGMGKTEAALALAAQRWKTGDEQGIYFALPTQLTSDRIHERLAPFLEKAISSNHAQSLVHGSAWLNEKRIASINTGDSTNEALRWFASSRRALLAPFGVGTIDQALLSILSVKHSALRLFALAGKTVILDEVHSYDPYTFSLVCRLVEVLTACGSTVTILSATLTHEARRRLITAAGGHETSDQEAYPLISAVKTNTAENLTSYADLSIHAPAEKTIQLLHSSAADSDFESAALTAAQAGACVLIIRNTVQLAQETFACLKNAARVGFQIGLLHSRFPFFARQKRETCWVEKLSKDSKERPAGCILVSTQVVEQSIDIDADFLITDLAPADLLLQRIGRLHRHEMTPRPASFATPRAMILHPEIKEQNDHRQLKAELGKSAFIYPPDSLLRAHHDWRGRNAIQLPSQIRELLEQENERQRPLNPAEEALVADTAAEVAKQAGTASTRAQNLLSPRALSDDDEGHLTRWKSLPSSIIILLTQQPEMNGNQLTLHFLNGKSHTTSTDCPFDFELAKLLHANAAKIPAYALPRALFGDSILASYFFEHAVCAVLEEGIGGQCHFPGTSADLPYDFTYTTDAGLRLYKKEPASFSVEPDDDGSWF